MADYAYAFKTPPTPPQNQYGYHAASSYISPSSSSQPSSSSTYTNLAIPASGNTINMGSTSNPIAPPTPLLWTDLEP
jgi:hypothetical protein